MAAIREWIRILRLARVEKLKRDLLESERRVRDATSRLVLMHDSQTASDALDAEVNNYERVCAKLARAIEMSGELGGV